MFRLTGAFLDAESAVGVLGSGVGLQLEGGGVVHERLRTLGDAGAAVVEISASLQKKITVSKAGFIWTVLSPGREGYMTPTFITLIKTRTELEVSHTPTQTTAYFYSHTHTITVLRLERREAGSGS